MNINSHACKSPDELDYIPSKFVRSNDVDTMKQIDKKENSNNNDQTHNVMWSAAIR